MAKCQKSELAATGAGGREVRADLRRSGRMVGRPAAGVKEPARGADSPPRESSNLRGPGCKPGKGAGTPEKRMRDVSARLGGAVGTKGALAMRQRPTGDEMAKARHLVESLRAAGLLQMVEVRRRRVRFAMDQGEAFESDLIAHKLFGVKARAHVRHSWVEGTLAQLAAAAKEQLLAAACNEEPCAVAVHAGCAAKSRQAYEGPSPRGQTRVIVGVRYVSGLVSSTFGRRVSPVAVTLCGLRWDEMCQGLCFAIVAVSHAGGLFGSSCICSSLGACGRYICFGCCALHSLGGPRAQLSCRVAGARPSSSAPGSRPSPCACRGCTACRSRAAPCTASSRLAQPSIPPPLCARSFPSPSFARLATRPRVSDVRTRVATAHSCVPSQPPTLRVSAGLTPQALQVSSFTYSRSKTSGHGAARRFVGGAKAASSGLVRLLRG